MVQVELKAETIAGRGEARTLTPGGFINAGFSERAPTRFSVSAGTDWELRVDDEPLPRIHQNGTIGWVWEPGFFAGAVRCELVYVPSRASLEYVLDVSPDAKKLGKIEFRKLIDDLLARRPEALLGYEPGTAKLGNRAQSTHTSLSYASLLQNADPLLRALDQIRKRPRTRLQATRRTVSLGGAQRVDVNTILIMARNGSLSHLQAADTPVEADCPDLKLSVPYSLVSKDAPATRCIVAMTNAVISRCDRLVNELETLASKEEVSVFSTSLRLRLAVRKGRVRAISDRLRNALRRDPFSAVNRPEITAAGLTAASADPAYAQARSVLWKILRPGIGGDTNQWAYLGPTWDIYEQWCLLRLKEALQDIYQGLTWLPLSKGPFAEGWAGNGGDIRVELRSQFTAPAWDGERDWGFLSISKELRPDFHLVVETDGNRRWWTFDAKYSQSRAGVLTAMQAAHVYRDALRLNGVASSGSYLLVPALDSSLSHLHAESFHKRHGVGVLVCNPDGEVAASFQERLHALLAQ